MNETKTEWRDCADPDELAAAVAAGVEVLRMRGGGWVPSALTHRDDFAWFLTHGTRYQLPTAVQCECTAKRVPDVPPAVDLRERTLAQVATGSAAWSAVRRHLTQFEPITSAADMDALASEIADAVLAVLPAPPVPPWPGAVLSGLTDEDGVPTWLAQAGNVQGESVRTCADFPWFVCGSDNASDRTWVEVRAPRAVPEPETERVDAWEAVKDGRRVVGASEPFEAHYIWRSGPDRAFIGERTMDRAVLIAPDGTVEVLKDGDR